MYLYFSTNYAHYGCLTVIFIDILFMTGLSKMRTVSPKTALNEFLMSSQIWVFRELNVCCCLILFTIYCINSFDIFKGIPPREYKFLYIPHHHAKT